MAARAVMRENFWPTKLFGRNFLGFIFLNSLARRSDFLRILFKRSHSMHSYSHARVHRETFVINVFRLIPKLDPLAGRFY